VGAFVFLLLVLPLVLSLSAWLVARLAELRLHQRPPGPVAVLPDATPYANALPGRPDRIVLTSGLLAGLAPAERRALIAHERAHLTARHLLAVHLAARANPYLRPLRTAVVHTAERRPARSVTGGWSPEPTARRRCCRRALRRPPSPE
jgi:Zn-dependent protease with chaperone function